MPSGQSAGLKGRSFETEDAAMRGMKFRIVPDFMVPTETFAAAQLTGANSGFFVFVAPVPMLFMGAEILWTVAGTNTLRVKKVLAAATTAAGAAAGASDIDISAAVDLTATANVAREVAPVTTSFANRLAEGDKVAIASALGTASLAGAKAILRFVVL